MPEMLLLTFPKEEFRALGKDSDLIAGIHLVGGHQAVERILKLARQGVLQVGWSIFGIAPIFQRHRFSPRGELHFERGGSVPQEGSAGRANFAFRNFLQVRRAKGVEGKGFLNAALHVPLFAVQSRGQKVQSGNKRKNATWRAYANSRAGPILPNENTSSGNNRSLPARIDGPNFHRNLMGEHHEFNRRRQFR
jgi:cell division ATPase FtsA